MAQSSIEWTEETWNPVTGCTRVSAGCDNCYAVRLTQRLAEMGQEKYQGLINKGKRHFNGVIKTHPDTLSIPLERRKPILYFVNSMSDLFHKDVPVEFIIDVFEVMARCPQHTFQILTKRPERMMEVVPMVYKRLASRLPHKKQTESCFTPLYNVWLGTSVENETAARERIPYLKGTPAAIRFLSCEPLLSPLPNLDLTSINWVIVGGESGPRARKMKEEWVWEIQKQCAQANIPFFFKQWGGVQKKRNGRKLGGSTFDEMPKRFPELSFSGQI